MYACIRDQLPAYALSDFRAAGFAGDDDLEAPLSELLGERFALRAFATAVYSLESDEQSAHKISKLLGLPKGSPKISDTSCTLGRQGLRASPVPPPCWLEAALTAQPGAARDQKARVAGCSDNRARHRAAVTRSRLRA